MPTGLTTAVRRPDSKFPASKRQDLIDKRLHLLLTETLDLDPCARRAWAQHICACERLNHSRSLQECSVPRIYTAVTSLKIWRTAPLADSDASVTKAAFLEDATWLGVFNGFLVTVAFSFVSEPGTTWSLDPDRHMYVFRILYFLFWGMGSGASFTGAHQQRGRVALSA